MLDWTFKPAENKEGIRSGLRQQSKKKSNKTYKNSYFIEF